MKFVLDGDYMLRVRAYNKYGPVCLVVRFKGSENLFSTMIDLRSLLRTSKMACCCSYVYVEFFDFDRNRAPAKQYKLLYESRVETFPD